MVGGQAGAQAAPEIEVVGRIGIPLIVMTRFATDNTQNLPLKKSSYASSGMDAASSAPGVFPVCKPEGVSSFRMVQLVRRILGIKKVGHTGTRDPFASGVNVNEPGMTIRMNIFVDYNL